MIKHWESVHKEGAIKGRLDLTAQTVQHESHKMRGEIICLALERSKAPPP